MSPVGWMWLAQMVARSASRLVKLCTGTPSSVTSLQFLADAYDVLILGPIGVGKTFPANALGHNWQNS